MFLNSKRTFTLLAGLMLALVFVGTSCKKDEEKTTKDLLTAHEWKLVSSVVSGSPVTIEPCEADDFADFHDDGTLHFDEGATKCDESDPQETSGTWSISDKTDPETLTLKFEENGTETVQEFDITEITSSKMVLTIEIPFLGTYVNTYEKA